MTQEERDRLVVLKKAKKGLITQREAAATRAHPRTRIGYLYREPAAWWLSGKVVMATDVPVVLRPSAASAAILRRVGPFGETLHEVRIEGAQVLAGTANSRDLSESG